MLQIRYRGRHTDGTWRWLSRRVTPFRRRPDGTVVEVLTVVRDITDLVDVEDKLRYVALHDPMTGLANRALLTDRLDHALAQASDSAATWRCCSAT